MSQWYRTLNVKIVIISENEPINCKDSNLRICLDIFLQKPFVLISYFHLICCVVVANAKTSQIRAKNSGCPTDKLHLLKFPQQLHLARVRFESVVLL